MRRLYFPLISCVGTILAASTASWYLANHVESLPDPRFPARYDLGAHLPFPVIMDHPHALSFLAIFWTMVAVLAVAGLKLASAVAKHPQPKRALFISAGALLIAMMFFPVLFSVDSYAYLLFARLYGVFHLNPYGLNTMVLPIDAVTKTLTTFLGVQLPPDNYGPLWTLFAGGVGAL